MYLDIKHPSLSLSLCVYIMCVYIYIYIYTYIHMHIYMIPIMLCILIRIWQCLSVLDLLSALHPVRSGIGKVSCRARCTSGWSGAGWWPSRTPRLAQYIYIYICTEHWAPSLHDSAVRMRLVWVVYACKHVCVYASMHICQACTHVGICLSRCAMCIMQSCVYIYIYIYIYKCVYIEVWGL